jgi:hypothetical protein
LTSSLGKFENGSSDFRQVLQCGGDVTRWHAYLVGEHNPLTHPSPPNIVFLKEMGILISLIITPASRNLGGLFLYIVLKYSVWIWIKY